MALTPLFSTKVAMHLYRRRGEPMDHDTPEYLELEQAVLRVIIGGLILVYVLCDVWRGGLPDADSRHTLIFTVGFFVYAVALAVRIDRARNISVVRRIGAILGDNAANTWFMLLGGEHGAAVVGVYLFVAFGYGFRFGRSYLHISQGAGIAGFALILWVSPFWAHNRGIGIGLLLAMAVLPFYVGVLAERLVEARKRAEDANRAKGRFLASMSHEMRTPLNGVLAMSDLLRETNLNEAQREIVGTLTTSAQLLLAQIEDVLDEAKIEAGRIRIERQPFDLGRLLGATIKLLLPQARYKGLVLNADIEPAAARWYVGDEHHLRQVLLNLLSNAVKFTERGEILLRVKLLAAGEPDAHLRFEVQDTGIGIPADKHGAIFEPFTQADDSIARIYGGTGLGTTIAQQLVGLMGGRIEVSSSVGVGSTFSFELRLPCAEPATADASTDLGKPSGAAFTLDAVRANNVSTIRRARILVAEDNPTNQRVTQMLLESGGHHVTVVDNGEAALDMLEQGNFNIALFDLAMPGVTGLQALQLYRFSTATPIPVIICSATVSKETIAQCEQAGAAEFLAKPIRAATLLSAIERHMGAAQARGRILSVSPSYREDERVPLTVVEPPPVDWQVVAELARLSPDPTFIDRLIDGFAADCVRLVSEVSQAMAKGRFEAVRDGAHALKGAAASVGARKLHQYALRLERASPQSLRSRASGWIGELDAIAASTMADLNAHAERGLGRDPLGR